MGRGAIAEVSAGREWDLLTQGVAGTPRLRPMIVAADVGPFVTANGAWIRPFTRQELPGRNFDRSARERVSRLWFWPAAEPRSGKSGSHWTLPWSEPDSNFQSPRTRASHSIEPGPGSAASATCFR